MSKDTDPTETDEWMSAFDSVCRVSGKERAAFLLEKLRSHAQANDVSVPRAATTNFCNTIPVEREQRLPGDLFMERRIRSLIRWNALAMVMRANKKSEGIGGHIASFASAATLYDVGFNHFFRGSQGDQLGDLIYFQGHSAPGMYARSFLEGRFTERDLDGFRREVS